MRKIRKALIPAAGLGTRFLPATKTIPKEMLAVVDKPMIQYAVEEAAASGIFQIGIVTTQWKTSIAEYFGRQGKTEKLLREKGRADLLQVLEKVSRMAKFTFIEQPEPRGLGHAILMGERFIRDEPFAVLNPDTIYDGPRPCLSELLRVFEEKQATVVVLGRIGRAGADKYGLVKAKKTSEGVFDILDLAEKPGKRRVFSNLAVLGRYVFTAEIFGAIKKTRPGKAGEIQITDAIKVLLESQPVYGFLFEGRHYDAGDKFGFLEATIGLALKRREFRDKLKKLMKSFR
jgi:UTP--glucose-1-phosphate uridylyltransferase